MKIDEIRCKPTCLTQEDVNRRPQPTGWHESLLRAHAIVWKVKELLELGTPGSVVLEMIEFMESTEEK